MSRSGRVAIVLGMLAVVIGLVVFAVMDFVASSPPTVNFTANHKPGKAVNLVLQTVGAIGFGPHPGWVSYLTRNPQGQWVHTTLWQVPADTTVHVTIYQYDTGSPLRNQQLGRVTGTAGGGGATLNGKPFKVINSYKLGVGHTFTIPALNVSVPLVGVSTTAKDQCSSAPCGTDEAHNVMKFTFKTPGTGDYRWQCFVPCGSGYLYGNGGPMSTVGYMGGFLKVVA